MTAFAISFRRDQITVAADTLAYLPDREQGRPLGFMSKVFPVPHLRAALFCRGMMQIPALAAVRLALSPQLSTLEDAAAELPEILRGETQRWAQEQGVADPENLLIAEVAFCGWSEARRVMRIWYFPNSNGYEPQDDGGQHYGLLAMPRLAEHDMPKPAGSVDRQLLGVILAEKRFFAAHPELMGGMILGGEVQAWQITPSGISQRVIHRFADYEQSRHAGAAVTARILRGDEEVTVGDGLVPISEARSAEEVSAPAEEHMTRQQRRAGEKAARKARRVA